MDTKLVSSLIILLIVSFECLVAKVGSCKNKVPDKTLNPILSDGSLNFSLNLYKELKSEKNVFFSPFSIRVALAMTAAGAGGTTLTQMNTVLALNRFQNDNDINRAFQSDLRSFCPNSNYTLSTANRIYVQQNLNLSKSFSHTLKKYYLSGAEDVDFKNDRTFKKINSWVEQQTNGTIKDLLSPTNASIILINAIYFHGKWKIRFDSKDTKPQTFNLVNGQTVEVPTMYAKSNFKYAVSDVLQSQVLQLNYAGDRLAMHIILPQEGNNLTNVQKNFNSKNVNDYIDMLTFQDVEVYIPKFKFSYKTELNGPLMSMGMLNVFGEGADLSRMISGGGVSVSRVIHQAYVAVDEEGTTASAATAVVMVLLSARPRRPPITVFRVDRPCIYLIYDLKFKQILFLGNLDDPSSKN